MKTLDEQLAERRNIVAQQREMNNALTGADGKVRAFTTEEQAKYDLMDGDLTALSASIQREQGLAKIEAEMGKAATPSVRPILAPPDSPQSRAQHDYNIRASAEYADAFSGFLQTKQISATMQKAVTTQGGYLVPVEYEKQIRLKQYDDNIMRQLASVIQTSSQVDIPMEGSLPTFGWIAELGTYGATDVGVGQVILGANKLGGVITASEELLQDAFTDIPTYIAGRASLAAAFAEEASYFNGDGNTKPTGLLTTLLATPGNTTITSASNSTLTSADMQAMLYGLSRPYRKNASFVVADSVIAKLRGEKATTGQYLWAPSLTANAPDVYLGKPLYTTDFLPAYGANSVSAVFGDFSYYQIVDRIGWSMQVLNEAYALQGQVGFKMWERTDGKTLRPEAFVTLTTHA